MFCYKCGNELSTGMQFCPFCGSQVISCSVPSTSSRLQITVPLFGREIPFDSTIEIYYEIRRDFLQMAKENHDEFIEGFYVTYHDMDGLVRDLKGDLSERLGEGISLIDSVLSSLKIFGVTNSEIQTYISEYCDNLGAVVEEITEEYHKILAHQQEMTEYRQMRKASRGRVVGGGFGLSGAVKGMATAGAINMATGALHSIGNAFGEMGTAISASSAKDNLFRRSNIREKIGNALMTVLFYMHYALVDLINAHQSQFHLCSYTGAELAKANKIQSDLMQGNISEYDMEDAVATMLCAFPFSATHYKTAVQVLPGRVSQMADFAAFFGIDIYSIYTQLKLAIAPAVQIMQEYQGGFLDDLILNDLGYDEFCLADISTDMTDALESIEAIFDIANEEQFYFFPACDAAAASLLKNARDCYATYGQETPLLLYDATLMKSGKSGFLITDKHIYLKDTGVSAQLTLQDALQDIHQKKNESNGCNYLYFGEYGIHLLNGADIVQEMVLGDFIEFIVCIIIFLASLHHTKDNLWDAIEWYNSLPKTDIEIQAAEKFVTYSTMTAGSNTNQVQFCFECGAENETGAKYCSECGTQLL
ncbi:hypothetical protein B5G42_14540 [Flavonifractor sp. An91]|nr:hypothetical protein B5G42_14540 [Flavonifractor sp. An91]